MPENRRNEGTNNRGQGDGGDRNSNGAQSDRVAREERRRYNVLGNSTYHRTDRPISFEAIERQDRFNERAENLQALRDADASRLDMTRRHDSDIAELQARHQANPPRNFQEQNAQRIEGADMQDRHAQERMEHFLGEQDMPNVMEHNWNVLQRRHEYQRGQLEIFNEQQVRMDKKGYGASAYGVEIGDYENTLSRSPSPSRERPLEE